MNMVKIILKILVLPMFIFVIIAQMIGAFFHGIASIILGILSTIFWGLALAGYVFGVFTGHETAQMMLVAFILFIIRYIFVTIDVTKPLK